ncbi:hypothetical protein [Larkinella rosea]|uniref:Uncharacterized protein n=1 Tax=Larkinella rosea TaxID=2025312 RepID=A0A3P1BQ09_9BACT|nr:hypothetical protein [Larkinella rosea]RRB02694.1 hypothetical protein EHT25_19815 [Larkinella rosea]
MTQSLRELLLRRLNQVFWLGLLMILAGWGAWRFSGLAAPVSSVLTPSRTIAPRIQQLHLRSLSSLDSSVSVLRLAVMTGEAETVLLDLNEQIRQQTQEVTLLSSSGPGIRSAKQTVNQPVLLNHCLVFRKMLLRKASVRALSQHIAEFQSQVRHLQYRVAGN